MCDYHFDSSSEKFGRYPQGTDWPQNASDPLACGAQKRPGYPQHPVKNLLNTAKLILYLIPPPQGRSRPLVPTPQAGGFHGW